MHISRRGFLKYCIGSAATLGLPLSVVGKLEQALAQDGAGLPKVVWLAGANCTGCTVSLANLVNDSGPTDIADLLTGYIDLAYHPNLMAAAGDLAVEELHKATAGDFILAIEGGIPTAFGGYACMLWTENGRDVTAQEAIMDLAPKAAAVLSIGTCSSYGGIPAGNPNPTGIRSVSDITGISTINIPGCPSHPDWIVYTVANLLAGVVPPLDAKSRPTALFGREVHKHCPRRERDETERFGVNGCLEELGCKGEKARADCPSRMWNSKTNWCIGANTICLACTEDGFPDRFSPFYKIEYKYRPSQNPDNPDDSDNPDNTDTTGDPDSSDSSDNTGGSNDTGNTDNTGNTGGTDNSGNTGGTDPSDDADDDDDKYTPPSSGTVKITESKWESGDKRLEVKGKASAGAVVAVFNADTNVGLGAVSAESDGSWKFSKRDPSPVPKKIRVKSDGKTHEMAVKDAPTAGTASKPSTSPQVEITRAVWRANKSRLVVVVQGKKGTKVTLKNAATGAVLGRGAIDGDGRYKYRKKKPATVPSRVRVETADGAQERMVENAPA